MRLDDLRHELREIAAEAPPRSRDVRSVVRPAVRKLWTRRILAGAVAVVVVSGAVATFARDRHHSGRLSIAGSGPSGTRPALSAATIADGRWSAMASFPLEARSHESVLWTGAQMIVWGGDNGQRVFADGAAYDPDTNTWRTLPAAPIAARTFAASVWTGREMIVWGGDRKFVGDYANDGAAFDPVAWKWRNIAAAPLTARYSAGMVWTGTEAILIGGYQSNTGDLASALDAAAYDPTTDRWRPIAPLPAVSGSSIEDLPFVWTGRQLLVWEQWTRVTKALRSFGLQLVEYDPRKHGWRPGPKSDDPHRNVFAPIWTGQAVLTLAAPPLCDLPDGAANCGPPPTDLHGSEFDPATGAWTSIPHGPVDDGAVAGVWTGDAFVEMSAGTVNPANGTVIELPGSVAAWNPRTNAWTRLPRPLFADTAGTMLWTGHDILVWSSGHGMRYGLTDTASAPAATTASTTVIAPPITAVLPAVSRISDLRPAASASFPWGSSVDSIGVSQPAGCCSESTGPAIAAIDNAGNVEVFDQANWRIVDRTAGHTSAGPLDAPREGVDASAFDTTGRLVVAGFSHLMVFTKDGRLQGSYPMAKFSALAQAQAIHGLAAIGTRIVANVDNVDTTVLAESGGRYLPQYTAPSSIAALEIQLDVNLRKSVTFTDQTSSPRRAFSIDSTDKIMFIRAERVLPDKSLIAVLAYYLGDTSSADSPDTLVLVRIHPDGSTHVAKFLASTGYMSITGPVVVADDDGVSVLSSTTTAGVTVARYRYADQP